MNYRHFLLLKLKSGIDTNEYSGWINLLENNFLGKLNNPFFTAIDALCEEGQKLIAIK